MLGGNLGSLLYGDVSVMPSSKEAKVSNYPELMQSEPMPRPRNESVKQLNLQIDTIQRESNEHASSKKRATELAKPN